MSKFPNDWSQKSLKSFTLDRKTGANFKPSEFTEYGKEVIPKKGISEKGVLFIPDRNKAYVSKETAKGYKKANIDESFLVTVYRDLIPTGPSLGRIVKINGEKKYILAQGTGAFKITDSINADYLIQFSNSDYFRREMGLITVGSTQVFIRGEEYYSVPIFYPKLSEQKRIGEILSSVNKVIELTEIEIEKLKNLKKGMMKDLLTKGIGHAKFKDSPIGKIPESWECKKLGQISIFKNGDRGKNYPNREEYVKSGIAWINTGHILPDGSLSLKKMNYITRDKFDSLGGGKIEADDLVYCLRGNTIGKVAFVKPFSKGAIASSLMIIRAKKDILSSYLYLFLVSALGKKQMSNFDTGSAQPNLSAKDVGCYLIPVPPKKEQEKIVEVLGSILESLKLKNIKLEKLKSVKSGLMQDLLTGKIRVKV